MRGTLFLIVGPSGAGKDSLIAEARTALEPGGRFVFPQRIVTRPRTDDGETHREVDREVFEALAREGQFALTWQAHALSYGIPRTMEESLAQARNVVINVSRAVVDEARRRFQPVRVIEVTAAADVRAQRLRKRGRESDADIELRLARERPVEADAVIANDGALETAAAAFLAALKD